MTMVANFAYISMYVYISIYVNIESGEEMGAAFEDKTQEYTTGRYNTQTQLVEFVWLKLQ